MGKVRQQVEKALSCWPALQAIVGTTLELEHREGFGEVHCTPRDGALVNAEAVENWRPPP